jgi:hypothetical protein
MMKRLRIAALTLLTAIAGSHAETIESAPLNEVWLNGGFYTAHFQRDKDLNGANGGIGAEWRFSTVASATAGRFTTATALTPTTSASTTSLENRPGARRRSAGRL